MTADSTPTAAWGSDAPRSGLEVLRERMNGPTGVGSLLGLTFDVVEDGQVAMTMPPDIRHGNPFGFVHGGLISTLLDSVLGCSVHSTLAPGVSYTTIDLNVKFIRGVQAGEVPLTAVGRVVHRGRQTATSVGEVHDPAGRLIAHGACTCLILPPQ